MDKTTLKPILKIDEGFRPKPYRDTVGKLTIGYGRNLDDVGISKEEADMLLDNDIEKAWKDLIQVFPWVISLSNKRQNVLVSMAFNMGIGGLAKFKNTLALIEAGEYEKASDAMLKSLWAKQVGARADRLALMMKEG